MALDHGEHYEERTGFKEWFTRPPYMGAWVIVGFVLGIVIAAVALQPRERPQEEQVVVQAPAAPAPPVTITPAPGSTAETNRPAEPEEEAPQVTIRTVPEDNTPEKKPETTPEGTEPGSSNGPAPTTGTPPGTLPTQPSRLPGTVPLPSTPDPALQTPLPTPEPARPPVEVPVPPPVQPEPRAVEPPPVVRERPRPRPRYVPVPAPARETGRVRIYFDADSSTFDRRGDRMPLRVEVYVNGERRVASNDPEKREFNIGRLPEGDHEIEIVPYVGGLPAEPRRERIHVSPRRRNDFKAVLRREDGISRVSKFREQD